MSIEKEMRLKITDEQIKKIIDQTIPYKSRTRLIDITCGKYGFDSLNKLGYICRIRSKEGKLKIEIKKYLNNNDCEEKSIEIKSIKDGLEFLELLDMKPYLVLDRYREVRKSDDLLIYIDEFSNIGSYLEIEYQDSDYDKAITFAKELGLDITPQEKYGDIFKERIANSEEFKQNFDIELKKVKTFK